jgi:hypothetical protein
VNGRIKEVPPSTILSEMNAALVQCSTLNGRAQISIEAENTQQVSVDITMQTDSFIGLSFRVLGIEGARVLITPDSVRIIDRINKQYLPRDIQFFSQQFGIPADFFTLQNLLLGHPVFNSGTWYPSPDETYYHLHTASALWKNDLYLYPTFLLREQQVHDTEADRHLQLQYSGYKKVHGFAFSMSRQIQAESVNKYAIDMDWASVSLDEPVSFEFKVNPKYEVVH